MDHISIFSEKQECQFIGIGVWTQGVCVCVTSSGQGSCQKHWTHSQENINLEKVSVLSKVSIGSIGREREEGEVSSGENWLRVQLNSVHRHLTVSALPKFEVSQYSPLCPHGSRVLVQLRAGNVTCYRDIRPVAKVAPQPQYCISIKGNVRASATITFCSALQINWRKTW